MLNEDKSANEGSLSIADSSEGNRNLLSSHCVYCGDFNECQDHVIPVAYNSGNRRLDRGITVDCCNMCNSLAGDFVAETIIQKAIYLEDRYQRKHKVGGPRWTREELKELHGGLKNYVEKKQFANLLIGAKLKNLDRVINGYKPNPIRAVYKRVEYTSMVKAFKHEYE